MMIETDLKEVLNKFKQDFAKLNQRLDRIEGDLTSLKVSQAEIKGDLSTLKPTFRRLKQEQTSSSVCVSGFEPFVNKGKSR